MTTQPITIGLLTREQAHYKALIEAKLPAGIVLLEQSDEALSRAEILLAEPQLLAKQFATGLPFEKLQWVQSTFAGVDALLGDGCRQNYLLTNVRGIFGPPMSEYIFGYLLARIRQHQAYDAAQRAGRWQPLPGDTLQGKSLLLLGCGDIARHIAKTAVLFGMRVLGVSRSGQAIDGFVQVWPVSQLVEALPHADVVISVLPSTPDTHGLLNHRALSCCKPGAILFNVGRGSVLEEKALLHALEHGPLGSAVLDVFNTEPLPSDSPLWRHPAITITPHVSAISVPEQIAQVFIDNLTRFQAKQALKYQIDFKRGY